MERQRQVFFHCAATVSGLGLSLLALLLALVFLVDGFANPQRQFALINYVFAALGLCFSCLIFAMSRTYDRVCCGLPMANQGIGKRLGWYLTALYAVLIGLLALGAAGIGARLLQGQHIFG
ncbi:hypothetical protein ACYB9R_02625 [Alcaligenes aquatilis]|uniref:hypothetical protein n=1 Tax=Alcaligenes sp. MMA TaxID=2893019 RepID=UPI001E3AC7AC|nr:hypothetical protein [Alcaligenes sp. MMA]MCC9162811.1 hypothetical protein [Alcaligenes sp. MMA]